MKIIQSKLIQYSSKCAVSEAHRVLEKARKCQCQLFISKGSQTIEVKGLHTLVSFFLTLKQGDSYLLITEGNGDNNILNSFNQPKEKVATTFGR
jgi:hypothetical protein